MALKGVTKDSNNCTAFLRLRNIFARRNTQKVKSTAAIMGLFISIATIMSSSPLTSYIGVVHAQTLAGTNFPPPIFYTIRDQPSYEISIPFTSTGKAAFVPPEVSIPVGMTIIWFNNDNGEHSVTTLTNNTYSPPETIDSGPIVQDGGSFIHTFNHPGKYVYFDQFNPSARGLISVGSGIETGKNFSMHIGGINSMPFNPNKAQSIVFSFVPKTVSYPPTVAITYNVKLLNSNGKPIYSHSYDDSDGILDLELVPVHKLSSSSSSSSSQTVASLPYADNATVHQFTTWGPDFIGQEAVYSTGTFHIRGPVLVQNSPYSIQISIVGKDNSILSNPISDTFVLPQRVLN